MLKMSPILKLKKNNSKKESDFEIKYQLSLTVAERFEMALKRSEEIKEMLLNNGHRKAFEIIKRKK